MGIVTIAIFVAVLATISFEWVHRTKAALAGAGLVILIGAIDEEHAIESVEFGTLGLLAGMMLIVALTERTGVFTYLAVRAAQLSGGKSLRLVFLMAGVTGVLSAFLDNLTAILLIVPLTLLLADILRISAISLVLIEVLASNLGGAATLIGDPPNILIGSAVEELSFVDFIVNMAPVAFISLFAVTGLLYLLLRSRLQIAPEAWVRIQQMHPERDLKNAPYLKRSLAVLAGTIVLFFVHAQLGLEPWVVALAGATVLLLVAADDVEEALSKIEWSTLFFFMGLFVLVGALVEQGVLERLSGVIADAGGGSTVTEGMIILWGAAAGSAIVDNIPFTTAMIPVAKELQAGKPFDDGLWWALAFGASFGGNATVIAAAANVAATGVLERAGKKVSFGRFLAIGLPATILSMLIATAYLLLFQL